jgi:hypothetical protein
VYIHASPFRPIRLPKPLTICHISAGLGGLYAFAGYHDTSARDVQSHSRRLAMIARASPRQVRPALGLSKDPHSGKAVQDRSVAASTPAAQQSGRLGGAGLMRRTPPAAMQTAGLVAFDERPDGTGATKDMLPPRAECPRARRRPYTLVPPLGARRVDRCRTSGWLWWC